MAEKVITHINYTVSDSNHLRQLIRERVRKAGGTWEGNQVPTNEQIESFITTTIHGMIGQEQNLEWAIAWFQKNSFRAGLTNVEITLGEI